MSKYKYYFRQPRSKITKDVLYWLAVTGAVSIAASSPFFITNVLRNFRKGRKYKKKKVYDTFYQLKKKGYIRIEKSKHNVLISLTEKGRHKAGWMQIDDLKIKRPKRWDKKWRLVIFDINILKNIYRNAFRGKLKELGFIILQRSIWVCPFECRDEIDLLRNFFGLTNKEMRLIVAENIG